MDLSKMTDEQLVAMRDKVYAQIVDLQGQQAAIHDERTRRLKIADAKQKREEAEATLKALETLPA